MCRHDMRTSKREMVRRHSRTRRQQEFDGESACGKRFRLPIYQFMYTFYQRAKVLRAHHLPLRLRHDRVVALQGFSRRRRELHTGRIKQIQTGEWTAEKKHEECRARGAPQGHGGTHRHACHAGPRPHLNHLLLHRLLHPSSSAANARARIFQQSANCAANLRQNS